MLLDKVPNPSRKEFLPRVFTCFYALISPFHASIKESLKPFLRAYRTSMEIGQHETSFYSAITYCNFSFFSGKSLNDLKDFMDEHNSSEIGKSEAFYALYQAVTNLSDESTPNPASLVGEVFDCNRSIGRGIEYDIARVTVICIIMSYLFHDYKAALHYADICRPMVKALRLIYSYRIFLFFDALISLSFAKCYSQDSIWVIKAKESISTLRPLADSAKANHQNKVFLLEAELAAVQHNHKQAISCYQQAVSLSNEQGFPNEEALANERFGIYCLEQGFIQNASDYLVNAYKCYKIWGARSKMSFLMRRYPFISEKLKDENPDSPFELEVPHSIQDSIVSDVSVTSDKKMPAKKRCKR